MSPKIIRESYQNLVVKLLFFLKILKFYDT